jgi:hypothetical protein
VIVDASVWIDCCFRANDAWQVDLLSSRLGADEPIALRDSMTIRERLPLLHADADFDRLSRHSELKVVGSLA